MFSKLALAKVYLGPKWLTIFKCASVRQNPCNKDCYDIRKLIRFSLQFDEQYLKNDCIINERVKPLTVIA